LAAAGAAFLAAAGAAATTGAAGAATSSTFLETTFLAFVAAGVAELIILVAGELFMAGIRIVKRSLESIFDPLFIFAGVKKIL
jgi:hypothetical protein